MHLVNISIDDVSPHPESSTGVLDRCYELIDVFPDIKFTLFIPCAYWRTISHVTQDPLHLDNFPEFCDTTRNLDSNNFEVGFHGYFHGVPQRSNNDEFRNLNYNETVETIAAMREMAEKTKIPFKNILRPPAWRMSPESIKACADHGIEILALSSDIYHDGSLDYKGEDKKFKNVVYYNCCPPRKALRLYEKTEIVYHACEWDKNFLNKDLTNSLINFLKPQKENIEFAFMEDFI